VPHPQPARARRSVSSPRTSPLPNWPRPLLFRAALTAAEQQLRAFAEGNPALGPANLKRMVLPTERAVRSTLFALKVMNALPFTDLELGAVARKLARASAYDLPAVPDAAAR